MKKHILSIAICLSMILTMLGVFELSFVAHALSCICGSSSHKVWCEVNCNCGSTTSGSHEETCPSYGCANDQMDTYKGCSVANETTGAINHTIFCRKHIQACPGVGGSTGCTNSNGTWDHKIGCPLYKRNSTDTGTTICATCGWLFGEHYIYCRSSYNKTKYEALTEVANKSYYITESYTTSTDNSGKKTTYTVAQIKNKTVTISNLSDNDIAVISNAATSDNQTVYYCKLKSDGNTYETTGSGRRDVHIAEGAIVIIDLNGNRIWGTGYGPAITNYGTLIIIDSRPDNVCSGIMSDRGYYYFDDDTGKYIHSVRNAENAIFDQGYGGNISIQGGLILEGRTTRNNTYSGGTVNVESGKTYEEMYSRLSAIARGNESKYYSTYLVENNQMVARYGFGGGGVHNEGTFVMSGGNIAGCESLNGQGSAVCNIGANAKFIMNGGNIMYNFGLSTISADDGATVEIRSGKIFRNVGVGNGAIRAISTGDAKKSTIIVGESTDVASKNEAILNNLNTITNTTDSSGKSFIINMGDQAFSSDAVSHNSNLTSNQATKLSAFHKSQAEVPLIAYNRALARISTDGNGGGIYAESCNLTVNAAIITKNWAHYRGGGVDIFYEGNVTFSNNVFVDSNYCEYKGGGVSVHNPNAQSGKLSLKITSNDVVIKNNKAAYAGGLYLSYGNLDFSAGGITDNESITYYMSTNNYNYPAYSNYPMNSSGKLEYGGKTTVQAIAFDGVVTDLSSNSKKTTNYGGGGIYMQGDKNTTAIISGTAKINNNKAHNSGGGMYISKGKVTMNGGEFDGNQIIAGMSDAQGGALCNHNGNFVMNGGVIKNNVNHASGGDGGGISIDASSAGQEYAYAFEMYGGEIYNNSNDDDQGGGVIAYGNVKIDASKNPSNPPKIYNNTSRDNGGGVYVQGTLDMSGGLIYNNTAKDYIGGGVYIHEGNFNMSGGEIYGNKILTRNGGGVYIRNGNFTMTSGKIYQNTALNTQSAKTKADDVGTQFGCGGGVCIQNGTVTITGDSQIYENQAKFKGGAIYQFASARYSNKGTRNLTIGTNDKNAAQPQITNNSVAMTISGEYKLGGGAICVEGGGSKLTINNATISQNTLSGERADGGAILVLEGKTDPSDTTSEQAIMGTSTVVINNVEAFENKCLDDHGGFLAVKNGTVTVDDGNIYNNIACDNAGAIYVGGGTVNLDSDKDGNLEIHDNEAHNYIAGAIEVDNGTINMYGGNVYNNKSLITLSAYSQGQGHGGAFAIRTGTFNMYDGAIYNNQTGSYGDGGAIAILNEGVANVYGGKIGVKPDGTAAGNVAKNNGGAIYVRSGNIYIGKNGCDGLAENSNHNNIAHTDSKCGHPIIENNTAVNGGGLYSQGGTTTFYCGEMKSNIASNKGGGMYVEGGTVTINKGTVTGNKAAQEYYGDSLYMTGGTVTYTEENTFRNDNNTSTGVVVAGGTLENTKATTSLVSVYFKDRETGKTELAFKVPAGVKINLPDGNDIFGAYPDRTFIGWQYPDVGTFVRNQSEYYPRGAEITTEDNSRYVQGASANTMTLYGVWARDVNTISYYSTHKENSGITTNDAYETEYRYDTAKTITLPTPILAGYNFTGWTMQQGSDCKTNCNANWGISVNGDAKNAGDKLNTSGKFGNIHFVATWSATIQYKAVYDDGVGLTEGTNGGSVQVQNASTTYEDITINKQTSSANGAVATPAANYTFIGWYTDEACTNRVSTNVTYVPTTNDSGYYNNLTYYAKFALEYKDLTIATNGADDDQTFVFTVKGTSGYAQNVEMQVYVIGGNSYTTIKHIPAGSYEIYENNIESKKPQGVTYHQGNKWTWRYTDTDIEQAVVNGTQDTGETAVDKVTFNYFTADNSTGAGSENIKNWLNGLSYKFIG